MNFNTNDFLTLFWYFVSLFVFWKPETEYWGWRKEKRRRQQTPPNHALPLATNANVSFSDRCEAWRTGVKTRRGKEVLAEMSFTNSTELNWLDYFKGLQIVPLSEQPREDFLLLPLYVSGFQTDKRLIFSYYFYYEHSILPIIFKKKKKKVFSHCCSSYMFDEELFNNWSAIRMSYTNFNHPKFLWRTTKELRKSSEANENHVGFSENHVGWF